MKNFNVKAFLCVIVVWIFAIVLGYGLRYLFQYIDAGKLVVSLMFVGMSYWLYIAFCYWFKHKE